MTSYDQDNMLRELRSSSGLVLVRRRSGGSRAGPRGGALRERLRAAGAGLSSAKGKRSPSQRSRRKQTVAVIHSRPPEVADHSQELSLPSRLESFFPSPAASGVSSAASSHSCSRCSSTSSLSSAAELEPPQTKTPFTCTVHGELYRANSGVPVLEQERCVSGEFSIPDETCTVRAASNVCPHCVALHGSDSLVTLRERRTEPGPFAGDTQSLRRQTFLTSRRHHRVQPEVEHSTHRKSLWLDSPSSSWRSSAAYLPSGDYNKACTHPGSQDCLARTVNVGEVNCDSCSDSADPLCVTEWVSCAQEPAAERGPSLRKTRCDPKQRVFESHRVRQRSTTETSLSSELIPASPCVYCDQHLHAADCPSCSSRGLPQPRDSRSRAVPSPSVSESPPLSTHPEAEVQGLSRSPCCTKLLRVCSRMVRMRYVGRCLLLLLLTGLGGLFAHVTVTDHHIDNSHGGGDAINGFGGSVEVGPGYGGILPSNMLMKMNIRPVPLREFHEQLRTIRTKFDLLRIFLANKDISDAALKELLITRAPASKDTLATNDVKKREEVTSDDETYGDEDEEDDVSLDEYLDGEAEGVMADDHHDKADADRLLEELEEAAYHIAEMENNPLSQCKLPQPTVVFIDDPKQQNRMFHPSCTIINRCRNDSGCCGRDAVCGPKTEKVIFKTFLVVDVDPLTNMVRPDSQMVERIPLTVHTECMCRDKPRLPDCTQKCPGVFRMYRYGTKCTCDCVTSPNEIFEQCDGVKDGIIPLEQDDLVCIKSKRCGVPKCSVGEFNISTGYCPIKDHHSVPSEVLRARLRHQYQFRHHRRKSVTEGSGDY